MANYLKGIGDAAMRVNEILPSFDARILYFLTGHASGIIRGEFNEFSARTVDRGVAINSGMMQAHGYFGAADTETQINFVMPSATRYVQIYAEIDLTVVPNRFEIKATEQSNNTAWSPRQDNLRFTTNGRFQLHLWQATLTATTITLADRRTYINKPLNTVNAEWADTSTTQAQTDNSTKVATTSYVRQAISDVKNITYGTVAGISGAVKRQVNFVILSMMRSVSGTSVNLGTIPEGFRPKSTVTFGASVYLSGQALAYMPESINVSGYVGGTITTEGVITLNGTWVGGGNYIATVGQMTGTAIINVGWEI